MAHWYGRPSISVFASYPDFGFSSWSHRFPAPRDLFSWYFDVIKLFLSAKSDGRRQCTQAAPHPSTILARRCLSYVTREWRSLVAQESTMLKSPKIRRFWDDFSANSEPKHLEKYLFDHHGSFYIVIHTEIRNIVLRFSCFTVSITENSFFWKFFHPSHVPYGGRKLEVKNPKNRNSKTLFDPNKISRIHGFHQFPGIVMVRGELCSFVCTLFPNYEGRYTKMMIFQNSVRVKNHLRVNIFRIFHFQKTLLIRQNWRV